MTDVYDTGNTVGVCSIDMTDVYADTGNTDGVCSMDMTDVHANDCRQKGLE